MRVVSYLEIGSSGTCRTLVVVVEEKLHAEPVCFFIAFLVTKKEQLLNVFLTCTFMF